MGSNVKRFGTFSGVFVPNVLTIFGVILFLRMGEVVGNSGLLGSITIIVIANMITLFTALSLSAITTNIKIKGGGAYYLVSRSLGPEMGGAVGITLYMAQVLSIAFYIAGFTLSLLVIFPHLNPLLIKFITLAVMTLLSVFSAEIAIKAQYVIFALVLIAIIAFLTGNLRFDVVPPTFGPFKEMGFWATFALFFPAVTGIFAGLSLSGDLKDPHKNIPKGTISAIIFTFTFYILVALSFSFNFQTGEMLGKQDLMIESAVSPILVHLGIWAATLSSALGMILGAPRTLQALSRDNIMPRVFGKGSGKADEPRVALLLSVAIAGGMMFISSLDAIANILTMFFLSTYGIVNIIAAIELIINNPAYRPRFKVPWYISLLGGLGSFAAMFLINRLATVIAIVIIFMIYYFITRRQLRTNWGDIRKGFWASLVEIALANYEKYEEHPRNWRPHIAVFENNKAHRDLLYDVANLIAGKSGLVSIYSFMDDYLEKASEQAQKELEELQGSIDEKRAGFVYPEIILTHHDKNAHLITLQADGIGTFKANTIISDFLLDDRSLEHHLSNLENYDRLKKNVILVKDRQVDVESSDCIDIWLSGFQANISLMMMIPFLITRNPDWSSTRVIIHMIVRSDKRKEMSEKSLRAFLSQGRIDAEVDVISLGLDDDVVEETSQVEKEGNLWHKLTHSRNLLGRFRHFLDNLEQRRYTEVDRQRIQDIIVDKSRDSRLVILGVHVPDPNHAGAVARDMKKLLLRLPVTLLVKGRHNINLFI